MGKIKTLAELEKICHRLRKQSKTIGLITGCFDILHIGHVEFFRQAHKAVDILVIGLDNDQSISLSKGKNRPIFPFLDRASVLTELQSVDYVFKIKDVYNFSSPDVNAIQESIISRLAPDILITGVSADKYWPVKEKRAKKLGLKFLGLKLRISSSSLIISKLEKEF